MEIRKLINQTPLEIIDIFAIILGIIAGGIILAIIFIT